MCHRVRNSAFPIDIQTCLQKTVSTVTMRDIIDRTGFSQGGIYRFYRDIDDIFADMIRQLRERTSIREKVDEILGQTESFFAYVVEEYAARDYNIVYYDQRGAGKTWLKNRRSRPDTETLKNDLLEIVLYLKRTYGKEKIGILGHSWGSVLGSMFAMEHPEHTLCYIGCGQVINILENERTGYAILKSVIEKGGSGKDRKKLQKIGEYPTPDFDWKAYRKMGQVRSLQGKYGLAQDFSRTVIRLWRGSPIMGVRDLLPFVTGMTVNMRLMKELMSFDLRERGNRYQSPVYYVLGEKDSQTPIEISMKYFEQVQAPDKKPHPGVQ